MTTLTQNTTFGRMTAGRTAERRTTARRATVALVWALQITSSALFLFAGGLKVAGATMMVHDFDVIGLGQWFRYLTGVIEIISAVALLVPSFAFYAALALFATMIGAILTHLFVIGGSPAVPIALLAATATIAWTKRND